MRKIEITDPKISKMILGAHPDDLEIACGGLILKSTKTNSPITLVYTTNGSPADLSYYPRFGIDSAKLYAEMRKKESFQALSLLGVKPHNSFFLDIPDQKLFKHIDEVINSLVPLIESQRPALLFSPAYEGGHPDHDITRFVAEISIQGSKHKPLLCEYPEYNFYGGIKNQFKFIPREESEIQYLELTEQESLIKRKIFDVFRSQQKYIPQFLSSGILQREQFRIATPEDFSQFPHSRPLHYETVNIKTTPEEVSYALNKFLESRK